MDHSVCIYIYKRFNSFSSFNCQQLPDISDSTNSLEAILSNQIEQSVVAGQEKLEDIRVQIENAVTNQLDDVKSAISKAGNYYFFSSNNVKIFNFICRFRSCC